MSELHPGRREVLKKAVYVTPFIFTLPAAPAFAASGSGGPEEAQPQKPKKPKKAQDA